MSVIENLMGVLVIYDAIIAGYGPTGAVAANLLGDAGLNVLVVEPSLEIYDIPRAVHFDGEVMRIFQAMGLAEAAQAFSAQGQKLRFTNGRNWDLFEQDLTVVPRRHGWFNNHFFNQPRMEECLRSSLVKHPNVKVRLGWSVSSLSQADEGVTVQLVQAELNRVTDEADQQALATEVVQAHYLLGCDGAASKIRAASDIAYEDLESDEPWLVCDLMLDEREDFDRSALQICDPERPTTLVPCEGSHIRWEFMLNADDEFADMEEETVVRNLMAPHLWRLSPSLTPSDGKLVRAKVYHFHALLAETFQKNRVFLLGDSAHQMPPFLGQGLCAGIRDAYNLSWKLRGVVRGDYSHEVLATYTSERRAHVQELIHLAVAHGGVIQAKNPLKALLRDCYLMLGRALPWLVSFLKFGEETPIGPGLFATEERFVPDGVVGKLIPQSTMKLCGADEAEEAIWSDELLGSDYTLVGFGVEPHDLLPEGLREPWLHTLHIGPNGWADEVAGNLTHWADSHGIALALVRPDRQIFGVCLVAALDPRAEVRDILSSLRQQLGRKDSD